MGFMDRGNKLNPLQAWKSHRERKRKESEELSKWRLERIQKSREQYNEYLSTRTPLEACIDELIRPFNYDYRSNVNKLYKEFAEAIIAETMNRMKDA